MDILSARVALRERGLLDVLDLALRFVAANGALYARLTLLVVLPVGALVTLAVSRLPPVLAWAIVVAASPLAQIPFTVLAGRLVFERDVRVRDVLRDAVRVLPRAFVLRVLQLGGILGAGLACGIPGAWLAAAWLFSGEVLVLEGSRPVATLGRARRLVNRHFGSAAAALIGLFVLHVTSVLVFDFGGRAIIGELLQMTAPEPITQTGATTLAMIGFWIFIPFGATARFLVYIDLRTRSEAWDVQTKFAAIAARFQAEGAR